MMDDLRELYQEVILDHYRKPRNKGVVEEATHNITMNNPLCGDVIELLLRVRNGRIVDAAFEGHGCSISQASASMMGSVLEGQTIQQALAVMDTFTRMLHGDMDAAADTDLGDLRLDAFGQGRGVKWEAKVIQNIQGSSRSVQDHPGVSTECPQMSTSVHKCENQA